MANKSMTACFAGNICRSPTAEAMFRTVVERAGVADKFDIDSCGTGAMGSSWLALTTASGCRHCLATPLHAVMTAETYAVRLSCT